MRYAVIAAVFVFLPFAASCKARRPMIDSELRNSGAPASAGNSATVQIKFFGDQGADGICSGSLLRLPNNPIDQQLYVLTSAHCFTRICTPVQNQPHAPTLDEHVLPDELVTDRVPPNAEGKGLGKAVTRLIESRRVRIVQVARGGNGSNGKLVPIRGYWIHPEYYHQAGETVFLNASFDLAVIALGVDSWPINPRTLSHVPVETGFKVKVSGFGVTLPDKGDSGALREGSAKIDERYPYMFRTAAVDPTLGPADPDLKPDEDVIIGPGDSGGPALLFDDAAESIVGVIAGYSRSKLATERKDQPQNVPQPNDGGGIALQDVPRKDQQAADTRYFSFFVDVLAPKNAAFINQPTSGIQGPN